MTAYSSCLTFGNERSFNLRVKTLPLVLGAVCAIFAINATGSEATAVMALWPGTAPGDKGPLPEESDTTKPTDDLVAGKRLIRLGNVSKPTISVYQAPAAKRTGAAVVVCPGGGYHILAMDLEGTEVCDWLNSIGITSVLLKYRVPARSGMPSYAAAAQDAQRAMGLVRSHAKKWGIDEKKVGILGFSAGGNLAALTCNRWESRSYGQVDGADSQSCRPDFGLLIYPAYLTQKDHGEQLAPEINVGSNTPPTFMVMAEDDPVRVENVLFYSAELHKQKVPFELHVYPTGGHGYGLRPTKQLVTSWPQRATEWLRSRGLAAAN